MTSLSPENDFIACLKSTGTVIHLTNWYTTSEDLKKLPDVHLTLKQTWDPQNIRFPGTSQWEQKEVYSRTIYAVGLTIYTLSLCTREFSDSEDESEIFNSIKFNDRSINSVQVSAADADQMQSSYICSMNDIQPGELDFHRPLKESEHRLPVRFISKEHHSETTPEVFSERWNISIAQAKTTL